MGYNWRCFLLEMNEFGACFCGHQGHKVRCPESFVLGGEISVSNWEGGPSTNTKAILN